MTPQNESTTQLIHSTSSAKPILIGAAIGLLLISLYLSGINEPNPEWGRFWMIKPFLLVPLASACGGAVKYFLGQRNQQGKLNKTVAVLLSLVLYIIGLFLGTVLGLDGTLWN